MRIKTFNVLVGLLLALGICAICVNFWYRKQLEKIPARPNMDRQVLGIMSRVIMAYQNETGSFPAGDNMQIASQLRSHFGDRLPPAIKDRSFNEEGALVDPNGNIVEIRTSNELGVYIISAGKNMIAGDADDYHWFHPFDDKIGPSETEFRAMWENRDQEEK